MRSLLLLAATALMPLVTAEPDQAVSRRQGPPSFRSGVEVLEVDARVFDPQGRFVRDLAMDDFELLEDGRPQVIQTLFLVGGEGSADEDAAAVRPGAARQVPRAPHTWIFVLDQRHMRLDGLRRASTAIAGFLAEGFRPGDLAGIVYNDRMIGDRISSTRAEYLAAIDKLLLPDTGAADADVSALRRSMGMMDPGSGSAMQTLQTIEALADGLAEMPGPKTVVLLSNGFGLAAVEPLIRTAGTLRNVVGRLARAGARVYAVDTRGIEGAPDHGLNSLAIDTGGLVLFNLNNIGTALDEIAADTNTYYVLGYQPANTRFDGAHRTIEVRVKRPDLTVRARKGYLALPPSRMRVPK